MSIDSIYLNKPKTKFTIETGQFGNIKFTCASMQGWRRTMEDAILKRSFNSGEYLFGVLDGHGGFEVSKVVAEQLPRFLESNKQFRNQNYQEGLQETFIQLDKWLISEEGLNALVEARFGMPIKDGIIMSKVVIGNIKSHKKSINQQLASLSELSSLTPKKIVEMIGTSIIDESGTTANIVLIAKDQIFCANLGDSRSVCIQKGKAVMMSFDHKPTHAFERARIYKAGGFVMDGRVCGALSLSRAFGDYQYKDEMVIAEPEIRVFKDVQMILMACDGIWEGLHDFGESLTQKLFKNNKESAETKLKFTMNDILAPSMTEETVWGLDNMSCILLEFTQTSVLPIQKKIKKQKK